MELVWTDVCALDDLTPGRGVCALVAGRQVAVFAVPDGSLRALDNRDPFSGANVLSRGIVGDAGGVPKVASPVYKQCFDLRTGVCLDDPSVSVQTFEVRVNGGRVEIASP